METSIADLESRIAFQEDLIQSLNTNVYQQSRRIDQLELQLQQMLELLKSLQDNGLDLSGHQPPPHY